MANLFSVTAPLVIRLPSGERGVIAACFRHPQGLLYFDLYWHLQRPDAGIHLVRGEIAGEGPWKVGEHVLSVLGCQGSDPELAATYSRWEAYLASAGTDYPPPPLIAAIARRRGAITD